ncbi:MAG: septation protein A [Endomicrobiales bacterium]
MKLLLDFLPIGLFFVAFKLKGIYVATGVAIAAAVCQIGYMYASKRRVEPMMWISLCVLLVFGGFTLLFHNEMFIKWKPTILYWILASVFGVSQMALRKNLVRAMMGKHVAAPDPLWNKMNLVWILFFVSLGVLNLFVAYRYPTDIWVNFKLFGLLGCMAVFLIGQSLFLAPYMKSSPGTTGDTGSGEAK